MNVRLKILSRIRLALWILAFVVCIGSGVAAQIPATFQIPTLGYVFDENAQALRPIVGIAGASRIEAPVELGFPLAQAAMLPDQRHVLASSRELPELLLVDLENPAGAVPVPTAASNVSSIRVSSSGAAAAIYYESSNILLIVSGLPSAPTVINRIDLSFGPRLSRYAVTDDGILALLSFSDDRQDYLYRWTPDSGSRLLTTAQRIADLTFIRDDAVIADAGAGQVVIIRNVRGEASPTLLADSREGLSQPIALAISKQDEIFVADAATNVVVTLDASGQLLRAVSCGCAAATLTPLRESLYRLTDRLDLPIFVFDSRPEGQRILFIPALSPSAGGLR